MRIRNIRTRKTFYALAAAVAFLPNLSLVAQAQDQTGPAPKASQPAQILPEHLLLGGVTLGARATAIIEMYGKPTAWITEKGAKPTAEQTSSAPLLNNSALPDWAKSVLPPLDTGHVLWLYHRDTYAVSFQINRQGIVNAIVMAGQSAPPSRASRLERLGDGGSVTNLGDDLRKVTYYFQHPDSIQTYVNKANHSRTLVMQYNSVIFTIHDNRVARIQIDNSSTTRPGVQPAN